MSSQKRVAIDWAVSRLVCSWWQRPVFDFRFYVLFVSPLSEVFEHMSCQKSVTVVDWAVSRFVCWADSHGSTYIVQHWSIFDVRSFFFLFFLQTMHSHRHRLSRSTSVATRQIHIFSVGRSTPDRQDLPEAANRRLDCTGIAFTCLTQFFSCVLSWSSFINSAEHDLRCLVNPRKLSNVTQFEMRCPKSTENEQYTTKNCVRHRILRENERGEGRG